jgi:hypothetical protein
MAPPWAQGSLDDWSRLGFMTSLAKPLILRAVTETPATRDWIARADSPTVMHVFDGAVNLLDGEAGVLSLVGHPLGAGPFTMVLRPERPADIGRPRFSDWLDSQSKIHVEPGLLTAGRLHILLGEADLWDPSLPWARLREQRDAMEASMGVLSAWLKTFAPPGSFAPLLRDDLAGKANAGKMAQAMLERAQEPARNLTRALAAGDAESAVASASQLAGLGGGLTPSGDDFIIGAMYGVRLVADMAWAEDVSRRMAESAGQKTVRISQAWLEAAARGEASMTWHRLCAAVLDGDPERMQRTTRELLAVGHTSGADALTGFLSVLKAAFPSLRQET